MPITMQAAAGRVKMRRAQSILEYSLIVAAVVAALAAMQKYIRGSLNNKIQEIQIELNRLR